MEIFIVREGKLQGRWTAEEVHGLYQSGGLLPTDLYWADGMPAWRTLASAGEQKTKVEEALPVTPDSLKKTTPLDPKDSPRTIPTQPTENPAVPTFAAVRPFEDHNSHPSALPTIGTSVSHSPAHDVISEPARTIRRLMEPGANSGQLLPSSSQNRASAKIAWLVPLGRTTPFGAAPIPAAPSLGNLDEKEWPKAVTQSAIPPPLPDRKPATAAPALVAEITKGADKVEVPTAGPLPNRLAPIPPALPPALAMWEAVSRTNPTFKFNATRFSSFLVGWVIPVVAALILSIAYGLVLLGPVTAHRLNGHFGFAICLAAMVLAVSFFPGFKGPAVIRFLAVGLATLVFLARHREAGPTFDQRSMSQFQASRAGYVLFDPAAANAEVTRLSGLAQSESGSQRKLMDTSVQLLRELSVRLKACQDAERPMVDLGLEPSKLISPKALDARRAVVIAAQPSVAAMLDFVKNLDAAARAALAAKGIGHAETNAFLSDLDSMGKRPTLITYWQQESDVLTDMLANLDLLQTDWGKWHVGADDTVSFDDPASFRKYTETEKKLQVDLALQQSAQEEAINPSAAH